MGTPDGPLLVVLDGPAGAGKSTVARQVARHLGAGLLDTGAIYRTLAWVARGRGVAWDDEGGLVTLAQDFPLEFRPAHEEGGSQQVLFAGETITTAIRTPDISEGASKVSAWKGVREALLGIQRAIAASARDAGRGCVAEGRDMGSVVFPDADFKFFLTASEEARAGRRHAELRLRGIETTISEVQAEMGDRDRRDSSRATAPLIQARDAVLIDSSAMGIDQVLAAVLAHMQP